MSFCLGRKIQNRHHSLLVRFDSETNKHSILSAAPRLHSNNEFKQVHIATDMTKLEKEGCRRTQKKIKW